MLPSFAELGGTSCEEGRSSPLSQSSAEAFDEASYGVWSTIMNTPVGDAVTNPATSPPFAQPAKILNGSTQSMGIPQVGMNKVDNYAVATQNNISPEDDALLNSAPVQGVSRESSSST
eukprot:627110-Ditylum_brightwellii.AAC.1